MLGPNVRLVVTETLNQLEHVYGIEGVEDLGPPTVSEITERIIDEHAALLLGLGPDDG